MAALRKNLAAPVRLGSNCRARSARAVFRSASEISSRDGSPGPSKGVLQRGEGVSTFIQGKTSGLAWAPSVPGEGRLQLKSRQSADPAEA